MKSVNLIFPHQLFKNSDLLAIDGDFFLIEEFLFFKQYNFHQQKIAFHRATMKFYESYLKEKGLSVNYIPANEATANVRNLLGVFYEQKVKKLTLIDPVDDWLLRRIKSECRKYKIELRILDSPMYLNTPEDLSHFFKPDKLTYFQTSFYKQQRIAKKILIHGLNEPTGGRWSFDEENRKKFPKGKKTVKVKLPKENVYTKEAKT